MLKDAVLRKLDLSSSPLATPSVHPAGRRQMAITHVVENAGSNARDFCMLERNLLSHVKLTLLLFLVSCSLLLQARLVPDPEGDPVGSSMIGLPLASIQIIAAVLALVGGVWEYHNGFKDVIGMRAFLVKRKPHLVVLAFVVVVVVATCIILLVEEF
ncbi:hypothetical protein E1B28_012377 [Marasmius oreades]|uniref:DUF202 domain-containing protein n=1 Tax=Marasmius oreades TaxID=181124 RepID=A0A9P7RS62_9AGAR|nr:uncharacterized protein E1B28_012377 [Marasmius oreades]KAG7088375.1 hypothetical protein E1B28_012377 [Marasmius oreades]